MDRKKWRRRGVKAQQWWRAFSECWSMRARNSFSTNVISALLSGGATLCLVLYLGASGEVVSETMGNMLLATIVGVIVFLVGLVVAGFQAIGEANAKCANDGTWEDNLYIEHTPRLLKAMRLTETSGEIRERIDVKCAPERALAIVKMEVEPDSRYWQVDVVPIVWKTTGADRAANNGRSGGIVWKGSLDIVARATRPDASPVTLRVFLKEWEVQ